MPKYPDQRFNNREKDAKDKNDYKTGFEYHEKDLFIKIQDLGEDHVTVASTYNNIAGVYESQKQFVKALQYYAKSKVIFIKLLGPQHPHVLKVEENERICRDVESRQPKRDLAKEYREKFGFNKDDKKAESKDDKDDDGDDSKNVDAKAEAKSEVLESDSKNSK